MTPAEQAQAQAEEAMEKFLLYSKRACVYICLLYTSPSPRDRLSSRMPSSA